MSIYVEPLVHALDGLRQAMRQPSPPGETIACSRDALETLLAAGEAWLAACQAVQVEPRERLAWVLTTAVHEFSIARAKADLERARFLVAPRGTTQGDGR